jgi:hypothetical protein
MQFCVAALSVLAVTGCELVVNLPEGHRPKLTSLSFALTSGQPIPLSPSFSSTETFYEASVPTTTRIVIAATTDDPELVLTAVDQSANSQIPPRRGPLNDEIKVNPGINMIFVRALVDNSGTDYAIDLDVQ